MPDALPQLHATFIGKIRAEVEGDRRVIALLAGGSYIHGGFDAYSDLDFVVVTDEEAHAGMLATRREFAARLGTLLSAFTGEHVGEPRLLICLYGPQLRMST